MGDNTAGSMVGMGGTRVFELKAANSGTDVFEIIYVRSWEIQDGEAFAEIDNSGHHAITIEVSE